jgi:hypothetical protein
VSKRIIYVNGLSKRERVRLKAAKPVVQAAMDQAALDRTLAAGQKLVDAEREQQAELLAAARAAFPELRRRASTSLPPPVQPVVSAHRAGWYRRVNGAPVVKDVGPSRVSAWQNYVPPDHGDPGPHTMDTMQTGPAPFPAGLEV